jgi:adenylate kinase
VRVALTGTPGTGKTTVSDLLPFEVVHLNDVVRRESLWTERDADRDSLVVDVDALADWVDDHIGRGDPGDDDSDDAAAEVVVLESHLAHLLDVDRVVVLRCRPDVLESRLRERGERDAKARENAESEALDVVLTEAVETHGAERVYEIDTTDVGAEAVAAEIEAAVAGERDPSAGTVDFTGYLQP